MEVLLSTRWRSAYRVIMFLLCAFAFCLFLALRFLYGLGRFHAARDGYQAEYFEMYAWLVLALLLSAEAIFLCVFRLFTRTRITFALGSLLALMGLGGFTYRYVLPMVGIYRFSNAMRAAMTVGQAYMDSLTEEDFHAWGDRTDKLLADYEPGTGPIGVYGPGGKTIPADLSKLKIIRIDMSADNVSYVWVGGLDHTELRVHRIDDGHFEFVAQYNDERTKVIWPKK